MWSIILNTPTNSIHFRGYKFSRYRLNPRKPRTFIPSKYTRYTVLCMLIMFFVNCMQYTLPFAEPSRLIPGVVGFLVNISNQQSNKNVSTFLNDSDARSYVFSSTSLQQAGLEGDVITIVTVVTQVGRFHNNLTFSCEFSCMHAACIKSSLNSCSGRHND